MSIRRRRRLPACLPAWHSPWFLCRQTEGNQSADGLMTEYHFEKAGIVYGAHCVLCPLFVFICFRLCLLFESCFSRRCPFLRGYAHFSFQLSSAMPIFRICFFRRCPFLRLCPLFLVFWFLLFFRPCKPVAQMRLEARGLFPWPLTHLFPPTSIL